LQSYISRIHSFRRLWFEKIALRMLLNVDLEDNVHKCYYSNHALSPKAHTLRHFKHNQNFEPLIYQNTFYNVNTRNCVPDNECCGKGNSLILISFSLYSACALILEQSMRARNRVGMGLSYLPARARICKPFKKPRNRFPAWRAGTTILFVVPAPSSLLCSLATQFQTWFLESISRSISGT